ncbi:hypothetical protein ATANTOWER_030829 [Ataeniobius toweri]|uniref:Uncharacterized protein n=1 Tax=Ataeniobius toweri TaxID=208326 RepID=A0ABU7CAX0_9TELE|nr:hypothetical protein [Ataeniobius toweri]
MSGFQKSGAQKRKQKRKREDDTRGLGDFMCKYKKKNLRMRLEQVQEGNRRQMMPIQSQKHLSLAPNKQKTERWQRSRCSLKVRAKKESQLRQGARVTLDVTEKKEEANQFSSRNNPLRGERQIVFEEETERTVPTGNRHSAGVFYMSQERFNAGYRASTCQEIRL